MTEFTALELEKDVSDMEAEEAQETLSDFMDIHASNQEAYSDLQDSKQEKINEFKEEKESLEETLDEVKTHFAGKAKEYVNLPEDLIVDRFSLAEIQKIVEEGSEFAEEDDSTEEEEETDFMTTFAEREQKGNLEGEENGRTDFSEEAADALKRHGVSVGD